MADAGDRLAGVGHGDSDLEHLRAAAHVVRSEAARQHERVECRVVNLVDTCVALKRVAMLALVIHAARVDAGDDDNRALLFEADLWVH